MIYPKFNQHKDDFGYTDTYWFRVSDNKVIGLNEMAGMIGTPECIEAWTFNEFAKEAQQLGTKLFDYRVESKVKYLEFVKKDISKQIDTLTKTFKPEEVTPPNENNSKPNSGNKKIHGTRR